MFTKQDFLDYFEQVRFLENNMMKLSSDLEKEVEDEKLKQMFKNIKVDEIEHSKMLLEMEKILS